MPDYFYDMDLVVDPLNPSNVVAKGQVAIYDPADTAGTTLLALKDPSGLPLPNPLTSNANGFLPPRIAQVPQTLWKSGGFEGYFNSFKGLRDEAVEANTAAQSAANAATTAVAEVVATAAVDGSGALVLTKANGSTVNAGNVRGATGATGAKGDKGTDGANVLPTQEAIEQAIINDGPAKTAISAAIQPAVAKGRTAPAPPRPAQPIICFNFDDGVTADWSVVKPILDAKGIKGSFAVISTTAGTAGALTWPQIRQLRDEGHEILDHSSTHADLGVANAATLTAEVDDSYARFVANGVTPEGFCWPFAASSVAARRAVRKFYRFAVGGSAGTTQPFHTYAIKRVAITNSTTLATHQAQINAAITNNEMLIFFCHAAYDLNAGAQTLLGQVIDYAKASAAKVMTTGQAFELVGNLVDIGDLPSGPASTYTVVTGAGKFVSSDVNQVVTYGGGYALSATAGPATFPAGKIQYFTLNAPGNTDWPVAWLAGTVITDRTETSNALFTTQQFIASTGAIYSRRGATDTTWGAWNGPSIDLIGTFNRTAASAPNTYAAGKITYHAVNSPGNTDWPVGYVAGNIITNRAGDVGWNYCYQQFISSSNSGIYTRYATSETTWGAWVKSSTV